MAVKSLIKINLKDRQDVFLICNYKPAQKLLITLLDLNDCKSFAGYATDVDLRSQAAIIRMSFSDFVSLTKKALTQIGPNNEQFLYSLEKNCTYFLFKWKSIDQEETVVNIGSVKVIESEYGPTVKNVFLLLTDEMSTLNKKMLTLETDLSNVETEKKDALQLLSDVTDVKERVEKELYSKFILVLNEKKQKIRELKCNSHDELPSVSKCNKAKKKRTKAVHQISESSDEVASDIERMDVAGPSTSKSNNSLLFFDDEESGHVRISPPKRRIRKKTTIDKTMNLEENKSSLKDIIMESGSEDELFKNL